MADPSRSVLLVVSALPQCPRSANSRQNEGDAPKWTTPRLIDDLTRRGVHPRPPRRNHRQHLVDEPAALGQHCLLPRAYRTENELGDAGGNVLGDALDNG